MEGAGPCSRAARSGTGSNAARAAEWVLQILWDAESKHGKKRESATFFRDMDWTGPVVEARRAIGSAWRGSYRCNQASGPCVASPLHDTGNLSLARQQEEREGKSHSCGPGEKSEAKDSLGVSSGRPFTDWRDGECRAA